MAPLGDGNDGNPLRRLPLHTPPPPPTSAHCVLRCQHSFTVDTAHCTLLLKHFYWHTTALPPPLFSTVSFSASSSHYLSYVLVSSSYWPWCRHCVEFFHGNNEHSCIVDSPLLTIFCQAFRTSMEAETPALPFSPLCFCLPVFYFIFYWWISDLLLCFCLILETQSSECCVAAPCLVSVCST